MYLEIFGYPDPVSEPKISGYPVLFRPGYPDPTTLVYILAL